jgi:hypothetical protein
MLNQQRKKLKLVTLTVHDMNNLGLTVQQFPSLQRRLLPSMRLTIWIPAVKRRLATTDPCTLPNPSM